MISSVPIFYRKKLVDYFYDKFSPNILSYRNFRSFTRTADYSHRLIIACGEKKSQQITRTGG